MDSNDFFFFALFDYKGFLLHKYYVVFCEGTWWNERDDWVTLGNLIA